MTEQKNVPLTARQVAGLTPAKDDKGKPILCFVNEFPNNKARRYDKQPTSRTKNRRDTRGRKSQLVDITVKKQTPFGAINEPTGWVRKIIHRPVLVKLYNFWAAVWENIEKSRGSKDN